LKRRDAIPRSLIAFDVTLESAEFLRGALPDLPLAPSVAHPYDIARYRGCVGNTLLSLDDVQSHRGLFDWVWLDEWDTVDPAGSKQFYTEEVFRRVRAQGLKIALVTPELHASSPALLGGERHADASSRERLLARIRSILDLHPDAACTDHPHCVRRMAAGSPSDR
jgi:hypothetical protein